MSREGWLCVIAGAYVLACFGLVGYGVWVEVRLERERRARRARNQWMEGVFDA